MIEENNAIRIAHHLEEASKYAYALFWAQDAYKGTLSDQLLNSFRSAANAAGYELKKIEEKRGKTDFLESLK